MTLSRMVRWPWAEPPLMVASTPPIPTTIPPIVMKPSGAIWVCPAYAPPCHHRQDPSSSDREQVHARRSAENHLNCDVRELTSVDSLEGSGVRTSSLRTAPQCRPRAE